MKAVAIGAFMALSVTAAGAQQITPTSANFWLPCCKAYVNGNIAATGTTDQGFCAGVVIATRDLAAMADVDVTRLTPEGLVWIIDMYDRHPRWDGRLCAPPDATNGQPVRVVIAHIEARPQRMHEPFTQLTYEALVDAWPCRR